MAQTKDVKKGDRVYLRRVWSRTGRRGHLIAEDVWATVTKTDQVGFYVGLKDEYGRTVYVCDDDDWEAANPPPSYSDGVKITPLPSYDEPFAVTVSRVMGELSSMLIEKNQRYGNSALEPIRVFSKADAAEQLRVRIDDKLSRLRQAGNDPEDTLDDLIGYLILLKMAVQK